MCKECANYSPLMPQSTVPPIEKLFALYIEHLASAVCTHKSN